MCGRYTLSRPREISVELLGHDRGPTLAARYNVAPLQVAPVLVGGEDGSRRIVPMRWGLIPHWSKGGDRSRSLINARAETVAAKAPFRESFLHRRCVVAADGFYEWQRSIVGKQPFLMCLKEGAPFGFAGLWDRWYGAGDQVTETFTIMTTVANELVRPIHHRMPVILGREAREEWLSESEPASLSHLWEPCASSSMEIIPVSRHVNDASHDSLDCVRPVPFRRQTTLF